MQRYELDAWLGDDHGLNEDQINDLLTAADDIAARYPDGDDQAERDAALSVAYRLMTEPVEDVLSEYGKQRSDARAATSAATAGLQQAAQVLIQDGKLSESGFARAAGVDRMTVRNWLGKR